MKLLIFVTRFSSDPWLEAQLRDMACESVVGRRLMSFRPFSYLGIVILLLGIVLAKASVDIQVIAHITTLSSSTGESVNSPIFVALGQVI